MNASRRRSPGTETDKRNISTDPDVMMPSAASRSVLWGGYPPGRVTWGSVPLDNANERPPSHRRRGIQKDSDAITRSSTKLGGASSQSPARRGGQTKNPRRLLTPLRHKARSKETAATFPCRLWDCHSRRCSGEWYNKATAARMAFFKPPGRTAREAVSREILFADVS